MAPSTAPISPSPYAQAQNDEIDALQAIYQGDYEHVDVKGAWSTHDKAFRLSLRAFDDPETFVTLSVRLTATYPKSVPLLSIEKTGKIRDKTRREIDAILRDLPPKLIGEVMIYEIADKINEKLTEEVESRQSDAVLPSLEDERAAQEAAAEKLAREAEQVAFRKQEQAKADEDRHLEHMVQEELAKQRKDAKRKSKATPEILPPDFMSASQSDSFPFDRIIDVVDEGTEYRFAAVASFSKLRQGPATEVFQVQPVQSSYSTTCNLVLKRHTVGGLATKESRLKKAVLDLEEELEDLKRLRQANILSLLDFKITRQQDGWQVNVLTEFASKGSLEEMLEDMCDSVPVAKVRAWSIDLLEALDFYHRNGIVHKKIHIGNILFHKPSSGGVLIVKLADGGFQERLHQLKSISRPVAKFSTATSAFWLAPELSDETGTQRSRKTDIWDLGVVFLQMLFGSSTPQDHTSPTALMEALDLTEPLEDIIRKFFKFDPKKRPAAFDLIPCQFLRENIEVFAEQAPALPSRNSSSVLETPRRLRRESSTTMNSTFSKYANEWAEVGRLGKGGYGEVVKARNKLDGRIYAIKKLKQKSAAALTDVLPEVMLLSRLNHPYVVRYYTAWLEEDLPGISETEEETSTLQDESTPNSAEAKPSMEFATSTGGLDFISSSGYPHIEFGDSSDDNDSDAENAIVFESDGEDEGEDRSNDRNNEPETPSSGLNLRRAVSASKVPKIVRTTLYIQMEYCERHTLRDLIRKGLHDDQDERWRLFRQILEGLAHIHGHGIIHRDLKPDNIFIDVTNTPRIGDFGLATSGQYHVADRSAITNGVADSDMTRSIGTTLYVAPELKSGVGGNYNDKVDMYSLGLIFFEMCYPLRTLMERTEVIQSLRANPQALPSEFQSSEKSVQGGIMVSLLSHKPSERPSSRDLLHSGKLPVQIEDETIQEALKGISDPTSPYHHRALSLLFSQTPGRQVKEFAWEAGDSKGTASSSPSDIILHRMVKNHLAAVFERHGAVETQRQVILPRSAHYANSNVAQLLDSSGTLVQLPYDLILPHARAVARHAPAVDKMFTFGNVYRDNHGGGAPRSTGEADFDIISYDTKDLALKEAEVIKVMDEVIAEFPSIASTAMCFHLNHAVLLDVILDFCRIAESQRPAVKEILSKLNIQQWTWQKIRAELRSPAIGVSGTSLDDLAKFDWRDSPEKAFTRLRAIFQSTKHLEKTQGVFTHLSAVVSYLKLLRVRHKVYVCPLSNFNEKFYSGGVLFQCLYDTKRRDVLAAGGRYDKLIQELKPRGQGHFTGCRAVGMNIGWERLVTSMSRYQRGPSKSTFLRKNAKEEMTGQWIPRRCDILVASFDSAALRSSGVKLVGELWANDLSAELAVDTRSPEELLAHYRDYNHSWIIIIKHDAASTGKPDLRVKSIIKGEDTDVHTAGLLTYLRGELRDRNHRDGTTHQTRPGARSQNSSETANSLPASTAATTNVEVLTSQHRSKKTNKWAIVEGAQTRCKEVLGPFWSVRIAAIETKDEVMELIWQTRLCDPDGWRKVVQSVPLGERMYIQEIHKMLGRYKEEWEGEGAPPEGRMVLVYNFRTGGHLLYNLGFREL